MIVNVKNTTTADILHLKTGINFVSGSVSSVQGSDQLNFTDTQTFSLIGSGAFLINNGSSDVTDCSLAWAYLTGDQAKNVSVQSIPAPAPFAAKTIGTKKLYKRVTGMQASVSAGTTDVIFVMPYNWAKITGIEIVGGAILDKISLFVLDSVAGNYTGSSSAMLNQFGFNVNVNKDYYINTSEFDADLYLNMQIKVSYNTPVAKTIGINFILNEVK